MPLSKVVLLSFITLVTMVNPLAVIPSFVALTDGVPRAGRMRVAFVAAMACIVVLTLFLVAGNWVFQFFGITVPAFQIMGGIRTSIEFASPRNTSCATPRAADPSPSS